MNFVRVFFNYAWKSEEKVTFVLPEGNRKITLRTWMDLQIFSMAISLRAWMSFEKSSLLFPSEKRSRG